METKVIESKQGSLSIRDFLRGLAIAVGTAVLGLIAQVVESGSLDFDWKAIGVAALSAAIIYLGKNWLVEPPKTIVISDSNATAKEVTKEVKQVV